MMKIIIIVLVLRINTNHNINNVAGFYYVAWMFFIQTLLLMVFDRPVSTLTPNSGKIHLDKGSIKRALKAYLPCEEGGAYHLIMLIYRLFFYSTSCLYNLVIFFPVHWNHFLYRFCVYFCNLYQTINLTTYIGGKPEIMFARVYPQKSTPKPLILPPHTKYTMIILSDRMFTLLK